MEKVLQMFGMDCVKAVLVPLAQHFKLFAAMSSTIDDDIVKMLKFPYAQVVGCLMYSIVSTRSDITHVVSVVSKYMANSWKEH